MYYILVTPRLYRDDDSHGFTLKQTSSTKAGLGVSPKQIYTYLIVTPTLCAFETAISFDCILHSMNSWILCFAHDPSSTLPHF